MTQEAQMGFYNNLEGWGREGGGSTCVPKADSC